MTTQPVEVEVRITGDGSITPLRIRWNGHWSDIHISRKWSDDAGDHFLIMVLPTQHILDLIRAADGTWQARDPSGGRAYA